MSREPETLGAILADLAGRLEAEGHAGSAAYLCALIEAEEPEEELASLEIWGGEGAIWSVEMAHDPEGYDRAILRLAHALEDLGWDTPRTRQVGLLLEDYFHRPPPSETGP